MGARLNGNFATLLDELIETKLHKPAAGPSPTIPFDYLAVADELCSGKINVADETLAAEYRDNAALSSGEFEEFLAEIAQLADAEPVLTHPPLTEEHPLPSIDRDEIARELFLDHAEPETLARKRRQFAFANHPDRVAPHLRDRAMVRMQIANMLIDEASQRMPRAG